MASLNSFPFAIEAKMESRVLVHNSFGSQISAYQRKKSSNCGGLLSFMDHNSGCSQKRSLSGCRRGKLWKIKHVKAAAIGSGEGEEGKETEDAIRATIEKSKKVLAMQNELLEQIAERRRIVSSIKSSIINPDDELSSKDGNNSSTEAGLGTSRTSDANEYKSGTVSGRNINSFPSKVNRDQSPDLPLESRQGKRGQLRAPLKTLNLGSSVQKEVKTKAPEEGRSLYDGGSGDDRSATSKPLNLDTYMQKEVRTRIPEKGSSQFDGSSGDHKRVTTEKFSREKSASAIDSLRKREEITSLPSFLSNPYESSTIKDERGQRFEESIFNELSDQVTDPSGEDANSPPLAGENVMNVILVASECAPFVKTGGLGDVAGALPKALARRGHRVMVVAPRYGDYAELQETGVRTRCRVEGQDMEVGYYHAFIDAVDFVFIDAPPFRHLGNNIYGGSRRDILKRMILLCKAAVEVQWHVPCGGVCYGDGNLVFIANDWHTALLPVYLKAYYRDNGLMTYTRSILVIHNIAHQGRGPVDDFSLLDLPPHYIDHFKLYDPVGGEHCNIFAAGLKAADRIVSVSHGYAWELKTVEGGWGLHGIINDNDWKLRGIVNGIDTKEWSPQIDVHLNSDGYTNYSLETLKSGKAQCKAALQKELGLPVRQDVPLIGFIGRLDPQKGVDLIAEAIPWLMGQDVQLVMLGTGRSDLEEMLRQFESQHRDKIRGWVGFSVKTAHRITAGADILLMPSRFEPCGLNQLYAMSYGTIPVVHSVGGLRDTVEPFDPYNNTGLGWTFDRAEADRLIHALGNCLLTYRDYKDSWEGLQLRGMTQDLSWDHAADIYEEVLVAAKYQW